MTWIIYALLSAIFASAVAILAKIGLKNVDSTLATAVRSVVMAVFLVSTALILNKAPLLKTIDGKMFTFIVASGIAGALSWLFYFFALQNGPASAVSGIDRLSVVFVIILAALFLGEALTIKTAIGGLLIVAGAILLTFK
jgi:transporter family protein